LGIFKDNIMTNKYPHRFVKGVDYAFQWLKPVNGKPSLVRANLLKEQRYKSNIKPPRSIPYGCKNGILEPNGFITLNKGFEWDLATGAFDTPDIIRASAFHDFICNAVDAGALPVEYRRMGDDMFRAIAKRDGMPIWRRAWTHFAVVKYGQLKYGK
jgi:hypothetical protein